MTVPKLGGVVSDIKCRAFFWFTLSKKKKKKLTWSKSSPEINAWMSPLKVWNEIRSKTWVYSDGQHCDHTTDFRMHCWRLLCYKHVYQRNRVQARRLWKARHCSGLSKVLWGLQPRLLFHLVSSQQWNSFLWGLEKEVPISLICYIFLTNWFIA